MMREDIRLPSAASGQMLHTAVWTPDGEPRAVFQLTHGMAEYIGRYDAFARYLNGRGYAVVGHDHLGHGQTALSEGDLGFFAEDDASEIVIRDMRTVTLEAKRRFPGKPVFLLGHSMGSFFVRRYLPLYGGELAGAVIMGTGWIPEQAANVALTLARVLCRVRGERSVSARLESLTLGGAAKAFPEDGRLGWLSVNRQNVVDYEADPLCGFPFTVGAYRDFYTVLKQVAAREGYEGIRKTLPVLVVSGADDPIGGAKAVKKVWAEYRSLGFTDVTARSFPGDRHEILNENDRETVYAYLADWADARIR